MPRYDPAKDIPDLSGKVILVTGGTAGLGAQTVTLLAAHSPAQIIFTGRSASSASTLIADLKTKYPSVTVSFVALDLASLSSVQAGAKEILSQTTRLDILICNAGVMALPQGLTTDGYEIQFGTNHVGHALLVKLLLPLLQETAKIPGADVRVVSLTSAANELAPPGGIVFKDLKTTQSFRVLGAWKRYGQSKLANILYAAELARRYPSSNILFTSVHPGVFGTGLVTNLGLFDRAFVWLGTLGQMKDEKVEGQGAWSTCWAATSKREGVVNGAYYFPVGEPGKKVGENTNDVLAAELWEWTQKELEGWN